MVLSKMLEEFKKHWQFVEGLRKVMNAENREEALRRFMQECRK